MRFFCEVCGFSVNIIYVHIIYYICVMLLHPFPVFTFLSSFLMPNSSARQTDSLSDHHIALPEHRFCISGWEHCWLLSSFHCQLILSLLPLQGPSKTSPPPCNTYVLGGNQSQQLGWLKSLCLCLVHNPNLGQSAEEVNLVIAINLDIGLNWPV